MKINPNAPAFPVHFEDDHHGLTIRDDIAAQIAVKRADALIAALNQEAV